MDDTLYSDDLLPNDGAVLTSLEPPEEQVLAEQQEKGQILASAPILRELLAHFDERIALCDSIDGLDPESKVPLEAQLIARQVLKNLLETERHNLEVQAETFVPHFRVD